MSDTNFINTYIHLNVSFKNCLDTCINWKGNAYLLQKADRSEDKKALELSNLNFMATITFYLIILLSVYSVHTRNCKVFLEQTRTDTFSWSFCKMPHKIYDHAKNKMKRKVCTTADGDDGNLWPERSRGDAMWKFITITTGVLWSYVCTPNTAVFICTITWWRPNTGETFVCVCVCVYITR